MKAVFAQVDPRRADREDGGKGWVLIDDAGLLLIWGVGVLLLSCTSAGDAAPAQVVRSRQDAPWHARRR
jgi:hypothetical protein